MDILTPIIIVGAFAFGYFWQTSRPQQPQSKSPTLRQLLIWRGIWWAGIAMTVGSLALSFVRNFPSDLFLFPGLVIWLFSHWKLRRLLNRLKRS